MQEIDPDTHTGQLWTPERIMAALGDWITAHGEPPTGPELKRARYADPSPYHLKAWPPASAIRKHYPSLEAANAAAQAVQPAYAVQRAAGFKADAQRARKRTLMRMKSDQSATGSWSPPLDLPPTAAEQDPAPANLGPCPTCGQQRPNVVNSFATGSRATDPSLHISVRDVDSPLEPDGELAERVRGLVRDGLSAEEIVAATDLTYTQVEGVARAEVARIARLQGQEV
jgi:hypothetical protein